jgi:hypothetical protein
MKPTDSLVPFSKTKAQYQGFIETPSLFLDVGDFVKHPLFLIEEVSPLKEKLPELKKNTMLGKRAELFFKKLIESSKEYKVLADGIQVFKDKRTVGELDFIIQHRKSLQVFHTELTYKFYAYDPNIATTAIEKWIGPNRKDTLVQKLDKLNTRQFPLLHTKETQQRLKKLGLPLDGIAQRLVFKAQLFVPENYRADSISRMQQKCHSRQLHAFGNIEKQDFRQFKVFPPKKTRLDAFCRKQQNLAGLFRN